jgi:hypothetical protein
MAFSNTVSQTNFNTRRVIDNAIRRCKLTAQQITAEHIDIANDQLYLFLSDLANQGAPLWCIEKQIYPLYDGVGDITMTDGTVDILNSNFRTLQEVTGTNVDTSTSRTVSFTTDVFVANVGIYWTAAAVPIALERSDDGIVDPNFGPKGGNFTEYRANGRARQQSDDDRPQYLAVHEVM